MVTRYCDRPSPTPRATGIVQPTGSSKTTINRDARFGRNKPEADASIARLTFDRSLAKSVWLGPQVLLPKRLAWMGPEGVVGSAPFTETISDPSVFCGSVSLSERKSRLGALF